MPVTCIVDERLVDIISTVRRFATMITKQGSGVSAQTQDKSQLLHMYEQMKTIREFDERAR